MKAVLLILSALMLLTYAAPSSAFGPLDAEAGLGLFSKYVWRGVVVTDGAVVQPEAAVSLLGFEVGVWGNMDLDDVNGLQGDFIEIDYTLGYEVELPMFEIEAGLIHYTFPNSDFSSTTEIYAGAAANVLLSPSLTIYYDLDEADGGYLSAGISHGIPLSPVADLQFAASLGYGTADFVGFYYAPPVAAKEAIPGFDSGPTDFLFGVFLPYHPAPMVDLTAGVYFSSLLGDGADAMENAGGDTDTVFLGLSAEISF